jgi:hypothetical protein
LKISQATKIDRNQQRRRGDNSDGGKATNRLAMSGTVRSDELLK